MAFGWLWILCCRVSTGLIRYEGNVLLLKFQRVGTWDNITCWTFSCRYIFFSYGNGKWRAKLRSTYNLYDPVVRSTAQVYPGGWSAVYAYLDNPGMWNLRSQQLKNWYLGEELYVRVYDADPNPAKEKPSPNNILLCGQSHCTLLLTQLPCVTSQDIMI